MPYLVLALGAFLSIGGALSIYHGAGIVEVERGWTGVIAGATALSGGIVTIALGLVLKVLLDLRRTLEGQVVAPAMLRRDHPAEHVIGVEPETRYEPAAAVEQKSSTLMTAELESGMLAAMLAHEQAEPHEAQAEAHAPDTAHQEPAYRDVSTPELPALEPEPLEPVTLAPDRAEKPRSRFGLNLRRSLIPDPVPPPEPEPRPEPEVAPSAPVAIAVEEPAPAMDDWLDRAFSELDREIDFDRPVPPASNEELVPEQPEMAHAEPAPADSVAHAPEPPAPEPTPAPPPMPEHDSSASTVIGRYEADGTSYVMYADGSIEAQSEAGVYRFSSMTELRAFIESSA